MRNIASIAAYSAAARVWALTSTPSTPSDIRASGRTSKRQRAAGLSPTISTPTVWSRPPASLASRSAWAGAGGPARTSRSGDHSDGAVGDCRPRRAAPGSAPQAVSRGSRASSSSRMSARLDEVRSRPGAIGLGSSAKPTRQTRRSSDQMFVASSTATEIAASLATAGSPVRAIMPGAPSRSTRMRQPVSSRPTVTSAG
ncbi:hypothetical protein [Frankia sp. R43]|uniref:hypothetical protein n=1 Tax=Frankia sp. R43 TaxID=269536 RepID=UPI00128F457A|nr:hypothetical protein [Frankia sp. R43]